MFLISRIRAETPSQELFIYMKSSCEGIFCVAEEDIVPLPGRVSGPAAGSRKSEDPAEEKCLSVRPGRGKARSGPKKLRKYIIFVGLVTFLLTFLKISKFG